MIYIIGDRVFTLERNDSRIAVEFLQLDCGYQQNAQYC